MQMEIPGDISARYVANLATNETIFLPHTNPDQRTCFIHFAVPW